ncbi:MAG TPA: YARHG domain-containing protein [Longimicrobiaceae bacterium]|nr:YARHG domain-containing protein [Longimicrobiaceae bacterium]
MSNFLSAVSLLISLAALGFSIYSFRRSLTLQHRPLLAFARVGDTTWRVSNIGNGPALNVRIGNRSSNGSWNAVVNCAPLGAGESTELKVEHDVEILALYDDIKGDPYSTRYENGVHVPLEKAAGPAWGDPTDLWLLQLRMEAIEAGAEHLVTDQDLLGKTPWELDLMRNEYYARHGYAFGRADLKEHFSQQPWYRPAEADQHVVFKRFSPAEKHDVYMILAYQRAHRPSARSTPTRLTKLF